MSAERRLENKRMKVTKRMEVACLDTGRQFEGETEDVSDSGIRACLDRSPEAGSSVIVRLYWDDAKQPVETFGRVAWASPLPAGEGIEVGLMLGAEADVYGNSIGKKRAPTKYHRYQPSRTRMNATRAHQYLPLEDDWSVYDDDSIENRKTLAAISTPARSRVVTEPATISLMSGESFKVTLNGKDTWAKITAAGEIDTEGTLQVSLQLKDKRLWKKRSAPKAANAPMGQPARFAPPVNGRHLNDDHEFNPELWKARPLVDACVAIGRVTRPLIQSALAIIARCGRITRRFSYFAWKKIPLSYRARIIDMADALRIPDGLLRTRAAIRFSRNTASRLRSRLPR